MAGKTGRPRKEILRRNVELTDEEKEELKRIVMNAMRGEQVGKMGPLPGSSFANLAMFFLGDHTKPDKGRIDQEEDEFEI